MPPGNDLFRGATHRTRLTLLFGASGYPFRKTNNPSIHINHRLTRLGWHAFVVYLHVNVNSLMELWLYRELDHTRESRLPGSIEHGTKILIHVPLHRGTM